MAKLTVKNLEIFWERSEKGNGYAYPFMFDGEDNHLFASSGLTKRELFAAMAMQGLLANPHIGSYPADRISQYAVSHADSLIEALNEPQSDQGQSES